ncbi:MAG: hypothetical protein ACO3FI_02795 [Cyclobacteriaceae bacterium]
MNKKYLLLAVLSLVVLVMSCRDESTYPLPYNDRETGAYMRVVTLNSNIIDLNDLANSALDGIFEAVDEEYGELLEEFEILVSYRRGITVSSEISVLKVSGSEFQEVPEPTYSEYKRKSIRIPAQTAITALQGAATNPLVGNPIAGDVFNFRGIVRLKNGKVFTNTNSNSNITNGQFYNSTFVYSLIVRSVLAGSWLGNHSLTQTEIWSPNHSAALHATAFPSYLNERLFPDQTVTLSIPAGGLSSQREFTVNYRGETSKLLISLENGTVFIPIQNSGVDCTSERQLYWTFPTNGSFAGNAALAPGLPQASVSNRGSYTATQGTEAGQIITIGLDDDADEYGRRNGYCTWTRRVRLRLTKL